MGGGTPPFCCRLRRARTQTSVLTFALLETNSLIRISFSGEEAKIDIRRARILGVLPVVSLRLES